jgi:hypothetical protein
MAKLDPIISVADAAAAEGVTRGALYKLIRQGRVRRHADGVRLSEVRADLAANVNIAARVGQMRRHQRKAAKPPGRPSIDLAKLCAWLADQTFAALANGKDPVRLDHLVVTVSRADADQLLGAYRSGDNAAIRAMHRRLAPHA